MFPFISSILFAITTAQTPQRPLDELIRDLDGANDDHRCSALVKLAELGPKAEAALPSMFKGLESKSEDVRLHAAIALGKVGKPAVAGLIERVGSQDDNVRFYALSALAWVGADAKSAAPTILKSFQDKNDGIRRKAVYALGKIAPEPELAIEVLYGALEDANEDVRTTARGALAGFGSAGVKQLIAGVHSDKETLRMEAIKTLGKIGPEAKDAVPVLKTALAKPLGKEHIFIVHSLGKIGKEALPVLTQALKDDRPEVRDWSGQAIKKMGADGVVVLVDALGEKHADVRRFAASALGQSGVTDKMVVVALAFSLKDEDEMVRQNAVGALRQIRNSAGISAPKSMELTVPKLKEAILDPHYRVRQDSYQLLQVLQVDPQSTVNAALAGKDERQKIFAATLAVWYMGGSAKQQPVLEAGLKHPDLEVRMQAAHGLAVSRKPLDAIIGVLVEGLKSPSTGLRQQSFVVLQQLGQINKVGAEVLVGLLEDADDKVRHQVVYALYNVRNEPDIVLPALVKAFKKTNPNDGMKYQILQAIANQGIQSLPHLIDLAKSGDENFRQQAIYAIGNIQGDLKGALPEIRKVWTGGDARLRQGLVSLFFRLGEDGIPLVLDGLKDSDENVRMTSLYATGNLGAKFAKELVPAVVDAMNEGNQQLKMQGSYQLSRLGTEGADALVKLYRDEKDANTKSNYLQTLSQSQYRDRVLNDVLSAATDKDAQIRLGAYRGLQYYAQANNKDALAALEKGLDDPDVSIRRTTAMQLAGVRTFGIGALVARLKKADSNDDRMSIVQVLNNYGHRPPEALPILIEMLKGKSETYTRIQVLAMLGSYGAAAAAAIPALTELSKDPDAGVRSQAMQALQRIQAAIPKKK